MSQEIFAFPEVSRAAIVVAENGWDYQITTEVISMLNSTNKFKVQSIIFNNGEFAIASGFWNGQSDLSVACRWFEEGGMGYPQTFGKPQWMLLPEVGVDILNALHPSKAKVTLTFG